jgi:hypothetical protein
MPVADLLQDAEDAKDARIVLNRAGSEVEKGFHLVRAAHHSLRKNSTACERKDTDD